jgi:hypothetical protein
MTEDYADFTGISRSDRTELRAFLRRVRDGTSAGFENRRVGDANEETYVASPSVTAFARETSDAVVEVGAHVSPTSVGVNADADALPNVSEGAAALATTLSTALNDVFGADVTPADFERADTSDDALTFVVRVHLPSNNLE